MLGGAMCCGLIKTDFMVWVGPDQYDDAAQPHVALACPTTSGDPLRTGGVIPSLGERAPAAGLAGSR